MYLTLSNVFDVYGQMRIASVRKLDKRTLDCDVEIPVTNDKASAVDIRLVDSTYGNWKIVQESDPSKKLDSQTLQWIIHIPAKSSKTVKTTLRFKV